MTPGQTNQAIAEAFADLTTPHVADGALRNDTPYELAPTGVRPLVAGTKVAGRAVPVRHFGSVDVFLEAILGAEPGDVLVIDNAGRDDEGCIGDLIAIEAQAHGLAGIVVWGLHRDTQDIQALEIRVWSLGALPTGPRRLDQPTPDALLQARVGSARVTRDTFVFADDDGVVFLPREAAQAAVTKAHEIAKTERAQAQRVREGTPMTDQLRFQDFLDARTQDPGLTFRKHLERIGGAVEV